MSKFKFSNFQPVKLNIDGQEWSTVEHYYQAMKSIDQSEQRKIRLADTPSIAKKLGRKATMRPDWESVKEDVMMRALRAKFAQPDHRKSLLSTGSEEIVETNSWHDNEWGQCYCQKCKSKTGKNKLGKLLMKLREELRNGPL